MHQRPDLALLRVEDPPSGLVALPILQNELPQVAQDIHVIGHPQGLVWSYSSGVVSQIRDGFEWVYTDGSEHQSNIVQIQTAINPGNSGGPVLDSESRIVGLIAFSEEGQNLNYAIAPDVVSNFVSRARSTRRRGATVFGQDETPDYSIATDGRITVVRSTYKEMVAYSLVDADEPVGLFVEVPEGRNIISAWEPDASGSFLRWSLNREDGDLLAVGSGNGGLPNRFGAP